MLNSGQVYERCTPNYAELCAAIPLMQSPTHAPQGLGTGTVPLESAGCAFAILIEAQRAWGTRSGSFFILGSFGRKQRARSVRGASFPWPVSLLMTELMVKSSFSILIPGRNTDHSGQEARLKFHESHENRTRRRRHGL